MTGLFVRFYMSVIAILAVAMVIMLFAFHYRLDTDFSILTQRATDGGVQRGHEMLEATAGNISQLSLESLQKQYQYPIRVDSEDQLSKTLQDGLARGNDVLVQSGNELTVLIPLSERHSALSFGPVSVGDGQAEADMLVAVFAVLLLVAIAIAVLLRPLAKQFHVMEQAALSIADGNLDARVDVQQADSARDLAQAFNTMASRTEALVRTQRELLQAVSHELRTPLARINFAIDLIRTASSADERESRLNSLDTAAHDLNELVGELLQYVRLETGNPSLVAENIELLPLVEELFERVSPTVPSVEFQIGTELADGDKRVIADRSSLTRVLGNLLTNAGRFARRQIVVNATVTTTGTTVDVDDDGPGIPEPDRDRVFEPFLRLTEDNSGVGLGLALVKRIVINHNGSVAVLQSPLGGCRIRTFWPHRV